MQNRTRNFLESIDDNTFYRLMNNQWMDWRKLLLGFAKQFVWHVKAKGDTVLGTTCFVLDDTDIEKTGKTIEFIGRVFNHVTKLYPLGFKMLLLGFWDGKTLIATDFSLHREKGQKRNYGLTKKELKSQFQKKRESRYSRWSLMVVALRRSSLSRCKKRSAASPISPVSFRVIGCTVFFDTLPYVCISLSTITLRIRSRSPGVILAEMLSRMNSSLIEKL